MKAVMYGAGNIGRGFIGHLLSLSGYNVSFVDVNETVINALNEKGEYPVKILYGDRSEEQIVKNVCGVDGKNLDAVADVIAQADVMATAVGVNILKFIAAPIAKGLSERWKRGNTKPLNIIICENLLGADKYLKGLISDVLEESERAKLDTEVGFIEASIGKMVPVQTPEMQGGNILRVCVERYNKLPLDSAAVKGERPQITNAVWFTPFEYFIERKLFIHNMGHAMTAYLGRMCGYEYIWQAIDNPYIELLVSKAMTQSAIALGARHNMPVSDIYDNVTDLLSRFTNKQLGDTVARVGNDIKRKLSDNDRLVGAMNMCIQQGVSCEYIKIGIAAALNFGQDGIDMTSEEILKNVSHLDDAQIKEILGLSEKLKNTKIEDFKLPRSTEIKV